MARLVLFWVPSLLCGIHVVRTGATFFWLWFLAVAPILGPAIYFCAVIAPELMKSRRARRMRTVTRQVFDPERELRAAQRELANVPTVQNRMRVAHETAALGRFAEAEALWRMCVYGPFADDPAVLFGHARALLELARYAEALERLEKLRTLDADYEQGDVTLAIARALAGLGRTDDADASFRLATSQMSGLEAGARYVEYLVTVGRRDGAQRIQQDIERRYAEIPQPLRGDAYRWRELEAHVMSSNGHRA